MTSIFAILFFTLTQLIIKQQLVEEYCPSKTNLKQPCPSCGSLQTIKNDSTHNGKSKCQCNQCGRQFVLNQGSEDGFRGDKTIMSFYLFDRNKGFNSVKSLQNGIAIAF
jgi:transposase-like protein